MTIYIYIYRTFRIVKIHKVEKNSFKINFLINYLLSSFGEFNPKFYKIMILSNY